MVSGLRRIASTSHSLSWPADQREPAPDRSGASVPWNLSSAKGPVWHRRHAPSRRSTTIARPRAGSPAGPVREPGMESPTTLRVDRTRPVVHHSNACGAQRLIPEALRRDITQPGDDRVAERAGRVDRVFLDERHREPGVGPLQFSGTAGTGKATAENDHARLRLPESGSSEQHCRTRRNAAAQKRPAGRPHHRSPTSTVSTVGMSAMRSIS